MGYTAGLWMAGYDSQGQLRVSAQTYRQDGNDYWPGPIEPGTTSVSYATSEDWAKIWKITSNDINTFLSTSTHTLQNTPAVILEWPAKDNPYIKGNNNVPLTVTYDLAPFVDANGDGSYNALQGDYPAIKGDQALWQVFNDVGVSHNESNADPLVTEVSLMSYGYKRNSLIDNVVFYDYTIRHKEQTQIDSFVVGIFADLDLGRFSDDYIGFDSARNLGFYYNASTYDTLTAFPGYGYQDSLPMGGICVLQWNAEDTCGVQTPAGSFMSTQNNSSPKTGNPYGGVQLNNFLRSTWKDGTHLKAPFDDPQLPPEYYDGTVGPGPDINYIFDGRTWGGGAWTECYSQQPTGDRRIVIAGKPGTLMGGQVEKFSFALVASPRKYLNGCPTVDLADLAQIADTADFVHCNPLPFLATGVDDPASEENTLRLFPNPATDLLHLDAASGCEITIFDAQGRMVAASTHHSGRRVEIDTRRLAPGLYHIRVLSGTEVRSARFIRL